MKYTGIGTVNKKAPKWLVVGLAFFFGVFGLHDLIIHENKKALIHFLLFLIPTLLFGYRFTFPDSLFYSLNYWSWIYSILILADWIWAIIEAVKYDQTKPVIAYNKKVLNKIDEESSKLADKIKMARVVTYANIVITAPIWLTLLMASMGLSLNFGLLGGGGGDVIALVFFPLLLIVSIVLFVISLIPFFLVLPKKNKKSELVDSEFNKFEEAFFIEILLIIFVVAFFVFK